MREPSVGMIARREWWERLRHQLWQAPRPHGEQAHQRVVGPLELFYDLAVVVAIGRAAFHLSGDLTWRGLGEFATVFTLVWIAWANGSLHHELHGHDDVRARSTFLLQILVLVAMAAFVPGPDGARAAAFAVAAAVLFAVLSALWQLAARSDGSEYRRTSRLFVLGTTAFAVLLAGTAWLPSGARVPTWGLLEVAYLTGFAAVLLMPVPGRPGGLDVSDALIDRFGQITLIVLGETVTGVVAGLAGETIGPLILSVGLVAVVVGFGAWWTYFDFAGQRAPLPTRPAGLLWILAHLPLTAAIAAMGSSMVSLVEHARDRHTPAATSWVLGGAAAVVLIATVLVSMSLRAWEEERSLYRPLAVTCVTAGVGCIAVGAVRPAPLLLGLALVLLLGVPWGLAVGRRLTGGLARAE